MFFMVDVRTIKTTGKFCLELLVIALFMLDISVFLISCCIPKGLNMQQKMVPEVRYFETPSVTENPISCAQKEEHVDKTPYLYLFMQLSHVLFGF